MTTGWRSRLSPAGDGGLRSDELELGTITGVFGVAGEARLHLHHRESELLDDGREVVLIAPDGARFRARVTTRPGAGQRVLGRIEGLDVREEVAEMAGVVLAIPRIALPEPADDEYYLDEVVGMEVHANGLRVGRIVDVHLTGPVEILELDGERYLPSTGEHIVRIDRAGRVIHVVEGAVAV